MAVFVWKGMVIEMGLSEFERYAAGFFERLPLGIYCMRVDKETEGKAASLFCCANTNFYSCVGHLPEDFLDKKRMLYQVVAQHDKERLEEKVKTIITCIGQECTDVFEIIRSNGTSGHIKWSGRCLEIEGQQYLIHSCISVDEFLEDQAKLLETLNQEKMEREKLHDIVERMPMGVAVLAGGDNPSLKVVNSEFLSSLGYSKEHLLGDGKLFADYIFKEDKAVFEKAMENCCGQNTTEELEIRMVSSDGKIRWHRIQCRIYDYRGNVPHYILTSWDITLRKQMEEELHLLEEQYQVLEEVTDEFPFSYDAVKNRFRIPQKYYANGKVADRDKRYMTFQEMLSDIHEQDREQYEAVIRNAASEEKTGSIDYRLNISAKGVVPQYAWYRTVYRSIIGAASKVLRVIGRSYDISADRKIQEKLSQEMRLDPLTRILNKVAVSEAIQEFIQESEQGTHVLFLIDIDDFKSINDNFGHTVGDTVIEDVAKLISGQFRGTDIVGRIGGDEFVVFMKNTTADIAEVKAKHLCAAARKQLVGDDSVVSITLSIGIAVYKEDGEDYNTLFEMADRAMYHSKRGGKNGFSWSARAGQLEGDLDEREHPQNRNELVLQEKPEVDKDFLNFAFGLLAHARDINGSLNVLIDQIGRKYSLDVVTVQEENEGGDGMEMTNCWTSSGMALNKNINVYDVKSFAASEIGEFIDIPEQMEDILGLPEESRETAAKYHMAGIKFQFSGKSIGGLYIGKHDHHQSFSRKEAATFQELSRVISVFASLRDKIRHDQTKIQKLKDRDKLTGLYNKEAFRRFAREVLRNKEPGDVYAMVHVDINGFSYFNENFGQQAGDSILKGIAREMQGGRDIVGACHLYSDYFLVLMKGESREDIYDAIQEYEERFFIRQKKTYPVNAMGLSIGLCYAGRKKSYDSLVEESNLARKYAKEHKIRIPVIYDNEMRHRRDNEMEVIAKFYGAMQNGQIEVFLQPKFYLEENKIYGAEALARWRLLDGRLMSPIRFIPPLEKTGYIVDLDFYILEQLLKHMKRWKDDGKELFTISTNFSRHHFENGGEDFLKRLDRTMACYGIEPCYIEIEVTESVVIEKLETLRNCMEKLAKKGYRIAIDDFGTGYSSLSVLFEIPANIIKIDKSFIDRIDLEEQREFVTRMGQFIHAAKDEVVFEGIETEIQKSFLMDCGFTYGQGYLFDKPLPVSEFEQKYI